MEQILDYFHNEEKAPGRRDTLKIITNNVQIILQHLLKEMLESYRDHKSISLQCF